MLQLDKDKVCFIVTRMREYEEEELILAASSDAAGEEGEVGNFWEATAKQGVYESLGHRMPSGAERVDAVKEELETFLKNLDEEEQIELVALTWLGRGDYSLSEWSEAHAAATERHNERTAEYLMGMALLADYLEEGLAIFGLNCTDFNESRM